MHVRVSLVGFVSLLLALGAAGLLAACGGTPTVSPSPAPSSTAVVAPGTPTLPPSPTVPPSPTPTLPPTPTPGPRDDVPAVSASFPVNGDMGVPPDAPATLVFNRPMDRDSVGVTIVPPIPVTLTWAGDQRLVIAPGTWPTRSVLGTATVYTLTLAGDARTAAGEPLGRRFAVRFQAGQGEVPIPILMYHALIDLEPDANDSLREWSNSPASFATHMDYLDREGYNPIGFPALLDYLEHDEPVPPRSVLITFDDGHRTFPTEALPVLLAHKFKATLFVVTDYPEGQYGAYMSWDAIRAALDAGVDIGSHSMSHAALTQATLAEAEREIRDSKALIQERLGCDVLVFSYPFGAFDDDAVALAAKHGYRAAVTINPSPRQARGNLYLLNRVHTPYDATLEDFARWLP